MSTPPNLADRLARIREKVHKARATEPPRAPQVAQKLAERNPRPSGLAHRLEAWEGRLDPPAAATWAKLQELFPGQVVDVQ